MSTIIPRFEAHVSTDGTQQIKVDAGAFVAIPTADYFLSSKWVSSSTDSLRGALQTILAAAVASTTVSVDSTAGLLSVIWGSGSHSITFDSSTTAAVFGFTSTSTSSATTVTSNVGVPSLWLPNRAGVNVDGPIGGLGNRRDDTRTQQAQSGKIWKTTYNRFTDQRFEMQQLAAARVWKTSQGTLNSYEQFWESYLSGSDGVFRYYKDTTDVTTASYQDNGTSRDYTYTGWEKPVQSVKYFDQLWNLGFNAKLYAHS
jgi:hypothetical protein